MDLIARGGGPFRPKDQSSGEIPSKNPDIPISGVLLLLFLIAGIWHFILFITNLKRGHKFIFSQMCVGLSLIRCATFSLRIAWAMHPTNIRVGLASGIFVYAGTVLLFVGDFYFVQRVIRAQHPRIGWSKPLTIFAPAMCVLIIITLTMVITVVTQSFYTLRPYTLRIDRDIELYCQTMYAFLAFLPVPMVLISTLAGRLPSVQAQRKLTPVDKFGEGRMRHKIMIIVFSAVLLTLETSFRVGSTWKKPVPARTPTGHMVPQPWYLTKAAFYCFNFAVELTVTSPWLIFRVDKMFWVPNGAKGGYGNNIPTEKPLAGVDGYFDRTDDDTDNEGGAELILYAFGPTTARSWA